MNSDLTRIFKNFWHILSDVPGWSEPPLKLRIRRLIPLAVPVGLTLLLSGWSVLIRQPEVDAVCASFAPLVAIEESISQLNIECSDPRAESLALKAAEASGMMLSTPDDATNFLQDLRRTVNQYGWVGTFKDYAPLSGLAGEETPIVFVPAAGKMMPATGNRKVFQSLLELLAHFTASPIRMDLTRLFIRVDEKTGPTVELNFQIASHRTDEKAAQ